VVGMPPGCKLIIVREVDGDGDKTFEDRCWDGAKAGDFVIAARGLWTRWSPASLSTR